MKNSQNGNINPIIYGLVDPLEPEHIRYKGPLQVIRSTAMVEYLSKLLAEFQGKLYEDYCS